MSKKLPAIISYLLLFAALAFADASNAAPTIAIEVRQYLTMAIVGAVCIIGGIVLFYKTGHP